MDAIVLAGGRATLLGGASKACLIGPDGVSALVRALGACWLAGAERLVAVGPPDDIRRALGGDDSELPAPLTVTQEQPPCCGPAYGIAAGLAAITGADDDLILVLACDMPHASAGVQTLVGAGLTGDGSVATAHGHDQFMLSLYRRSALARACDALPEPGVDARNASVAQMLGVLNLTRVPVPAASVDHLDSPEDLVRLRFTVG